MADAAVAVEGRDEEVAVTLAEGAFGDGAAGVFDEGGDDGGGEAVGVLVVGDGRVQVGHDAPRAQPRAQLGPADVQVQRRRPRVGGMDDARQRRRRAQRPRLVVVVMDVGHVDRRPVEGAAIGKLEAHATAVTPAVAQPLDARQPGVVVGKAL